MRTLAIALVSVAACHGPPASAPPTEPVSVRGEARVRRSSLEDLLARPGALDAIEEGDWSELPNPPEIGAEMPPDPAVPQPSRPIARGDALELADLALARGDAFDAASQYRALVDARDFAVARYARFQLARAYVMLGEYAKAEALFTRLAQAADELAWPAVVALADLRATSVGASAALVELEPLAGGRFEALSDHLTHASSGKDAAELLVAKAARTGRCEYANQALALDPDLDQKVGPQGCWGQVEMRRYLQEAREERAVARGFQSDMFEIGARWDALADATTRGASNAAAWLDLAEKVLRVPTRGPGQQATASTVAAAALRLAVEIAWEQLPRDVALRQRLLEVMSGLEENDRRRLQGVVDTAVVGHPLE